MDASFNALKYGVGLDMGKETFYACVSSIDQVQRIKIKATHSFSNSPKGITSFLRWATHHCKDRQLPVQYLMEATGVYHEQVALALHHQQAQISVILPQKAGHYLKALGIKTAPAARQNRWSGCPRISHYGLSTAIGSLDSDQRSHV